MGERYSRVLAHYGTGDYSPSGVADRTLGDVLHPMRPVSPTMVVNTVSREVGGDVAGWRWTRVVGMYGLLEREAQERSQSDPVG